MFKKSINYLRQNGIRATIVRIVQKLFYNTELAVEMREIKQLCARPDGSIGSRRRVNLLLPSLSNESFFGGIATAFDFFTELYKMMDADARVIVVDNYVYAMDIPALEGFETVSSDRDSSASKQVMSVTERSDKSSFPVGENDIFIATAWGTAYIMQPVIKWQREIFKDACHPLIYMIQDFEPGFNPWSSRYLLAESTYKSDIETIAVFNSKELYDFIKEQGYSFKHEYVFNPVLNETLKNCLTSVDAPVRKKQIIVYGRPSVPRNALELIVVSLRLWAQQQPDIHEWSILSAGEKHQDIKLAPGASLRSIGKLSLEGYASLMLETYMGISLMVSPHPSYPPLEMSAFGIKTITNSFANKELSGFNENIISLKTTNTYSISAELSRLASEYPGNAKPVTSSPYVEGASGKKQFQEICMEIRDIINA